MRYMMRYSDSSKWLWLLYKKSLICLTVVPPPVQLIDIPRIQEVERESNVEFLEQCAMDDESFSWERHKQLARLAFWMKVFHLLTADFFGVATCGCGALCTVHNARFMSYGTARHKTGIEMMSTGDGKVNCSFHLTPHSAHAGRWGWYWTSKHV